MTTLPDIPPARSAEPMASPPDAADPTTAMLKADIDSGRTGDKNPVYDPGLSQLGTDDEAAGRPPSPLRVALARWHENVERWRSGRGRTSAAHGKQDGMPVAFIGFIVAVGAILVIGIAMVQLGSRGPVPHHV